LIYLENKTSGEKIAELAPTNSKGEFTYLMNFPSQAGEYYFVVASGNTFETKDPPLLKLIDKDTLSYPDIPTVSSY